MNKEQENKKIYQKPKMPDVSLYVKSEVHETLNQVGMSDIEMPIRLQIPSYFATDQSEEVIQLPARAAIFVNLDKPEAKGIHMSRLYMILSDLLSKKTLDSNLIEEILTQSVLSQKDLSDQAFFSLSFHLPLKRKALISNLEGWRQYPITLSAQMNKEKELSFELAIKITYSSTCPCSAALTRQLLQEQFEEDFLASRKEISLDSVKEWLGKEESIVAVPHGQRSFAFLKIKTIFNSSLVTQITSFIDEIESVLKTPVQTVVKREDEQEFARLSGTNLMFCEDAARKIKIQLEKDPKILDYYLQVKHLESLHAHDAVSSAVKGVPQGYSV